MKMLRATLLISGRVQGVSFRYHTRRCAQAEGVGGWVRNLPGGEVEALLEGAENAVQTVIDWCRQGPPAARVDSVQVDWGDFAGEFSDFSIRP